MIRQFPFEAVTKTLDRLRGRSHHIPLRSKDLENWPGFRLILRYVATPQTAKSHVAVVFSTSTRMRPSEWNSKQVAVLD